MRFTGRTEESGSIILSGEFWKPNVKLMGVFTRKWKSKNGDCYEFRLAAPLEVYVDEATESRLLPADSKEPGHKVKVEKVSIGSLKGFNMALDDLNSKGAGGFQYKDQVLIACTGYEKSTEEGKQDMINFSIEINRA